MKVLLLNEGPLSDYEVLHLVQERRDNRLHKNAMAVYAERNWIDAKVVKFLSQSRSPCTHLSPERIDSFLSHIEATHFQLTPAEKLQFINHCPVELVDIHLIVEDCASRFTEDEINLLIEIVQTTLVPSKDGENKEDIEQNQ